MLIYLHGFRSSPESFKAKMLADRFSAAGRSAQFACPQLSVSPATAVREIRERFQLSPEDTLVGSSLGGYYATYLAELSGCRAVLLNPAIRPALDLAAHVGELRTYHDDKPMTFEYDYLDELRLLESPIVTHHDRYMLIAAKGDEVIDWRTMVAKYPGVRPIIIEEGDHGLSGFKDHIDSVIKFAGYVDV